MSILSPVKKSLGGNPHRSSSHSSLSDICRDKAFSVRGSGTTTVPKWLHKLRLHKYTWIFAGMNYEDLFDVSMEKLLSLGVTQGGANKLLRNIQELHDRPQKLRDLEQGLAENKIFLSSALEVMQVIVVSPMRAHKPRLSPAPAPPTTSAGTPVIRVTRSDEPDQEAAAAGGADGEAAGAEADLQAMITRVLAKMCTQLLVTQSADDEAIQTFLWVLDEATWHEAFTDAQRRKFVTWKRQISLELGRRQVFPPPFRRHSDARQYHSQRRHSDARGYRRFPAPAVPHLSGGLYRTNSGDIYRPTAGR
ncbi:protein Smaug homolog 1-like [Pollicipes pollicipes]|uniref:protein Smaug homolog 1-like n=1 Tax=Pollicipes pollicipes TaxID=41117 RepID=UPI0018858A21|nr:protein Smaug homolog 1-like [Pollicipes pollicipes]